MDAATYELMVEHNAAADYHSELWASERKSMADEGEMNSFGDAEFELDEQLASGEISKACHLIRIRRLYK